MGNSRFGSSNRRNQAQMKWMVFGFGTVVVALLVTVVLVIKSSNATQDPGAQAPAAPATAPAVAEGSTEVLVAANRIELGERLEQHMFTPILMEDAKIPLAAIRKQDLPTVVGKYASRLINPNMPIVIDDISENKPINPIAIPPGYRAVTIMVDVVGGVEGWVKPNARVDVLWTYLRNGQNGVVKIVKFCKVLSVAGMTDNQGQKSNLNAGGTPATLLVTEKDAQKIQLAQTAGKLSLILVGDGENNSNSNEDPESISMNDLFNTSDPADGSGAQADVANEGVMYDTDPKTGRQTRYVLRNGKWTVDKSYSQ